MGEQHDMKELETIINVELDTSDLDFIINHDWYSYGDDEIGDYMQPIIEVTEFIKKGVESGTELGAEALAERVRSRQEYLLGIHGNIASMALVQSIIIEEMGEYSYIIGPDVGHFYPLTIEFGRDEVVPVEQSVLHYYTLSGVEIFSMRSRDTYATHKPFVAPAFEDLLDNCEEIMRRCIDYATN